MKDAEVLFENRRSFVKTFRFRLRLRPWRFHGIVRGSFKIFSDFLDEE
jgi:hypothetical protein